MSVLLDTCILIDYLRRSTGALAYVRGQRVKPAIATVSIAEIYVGVRDRAEERAVEAMLAESRVISVSASIARAAGQHVRHYRASHGLDIIDAIIAASAEEIGARLATINVRHFPMFPRLKPAY